MLGLNTPIELLLTVLLVACRIYRDTRYRPEPARRCYDIRLGGSNSGKFQSRSEEDRNDCGLASVVPRSVGGRSGSHRFHRWLQEKTCCNNAAARNRSPAGASSTDRNAFR